MSSNYSTGLGDWLQPGKKEARERAQQVQKRRLEAAAQVTDLETALNDAVFAIELDKNEYQDSDVKVLQAPLDRARLLLNGLYVDVSEINNAPMPEIITPPEAYQYMQTALRIESRANDVRALLKEAEQVRVNLEKPKQTAQGAITISERKRLQANAQLSDMRAIVQEMQIGRAENAPEMAAAFLAADREITTANQLIAAAQQALNRKGWREANDLAERSGRLYSSAQEKFETIKQAGQKFSHVAADAQKMLDRSLQKLNDAKAYLLARANLISGEPTGYLQKSVQRIGEARRALLSQPPQPITAYRLSEEANSLIDEALAQANDEISRIKNGRVEARRALKELQESIQTARSLLSSQKVVPVAANEMYKQARGEYERLADTKVDELKPEQLDKVIEAASSASQVAQRSSKLLS